MSDFLSEIEGVFIKSSPILSIEFIKLLLFVIKKIYNINSFHIKWCCFHKLGRKQNKRLGSFLWKTFSE